jgi:hypothetical protein
MYKQVAYFLKNKGFCLEYMRELFIDDNKMVTDSKVEPAGFAGIGYYVKENLDAALKNMPTFYRICILLSGNEASNLPKSAKIVFGSNQKKYYLASKEFNSFTGNFMELRKDILSGLEKITKKYGYKPIEDSGV